MYIDLHCETVVQSKKIASSHSLVTKLNDSGGGVHVEQHTASDVGQLHLREVPQHEMRTIICTH